MKFSFWTTKFNGRWYTPVFFLILLLHSRPRGFLSSPLHRWNFCSFYNLHTLSHVDCRTRKLSGALYIWGDHWSAGRYDNNKFQHRNFPGNSKGRKGDHKNILEDFPILFCCGYYVHTWWCSNPAEFQNYKPLDIDRASGRLTLREKEKVEEIIVRGIIW